MTISTTLLAFLLLPLVSAAPQAPVVSSTVSSAVAGSSASGQATTLTTEETDELFSLHEELVNIPSISEDEVECAEFLSGYLTELGYYVEEVPVGDSGTFNIFAYPQELKDVS
jgi:acetylornithine deacetylase